MRKNYDAFTLSDFGDRNRVLEYVEAFALVEAFEGATSVKFDLVESPNRLHAVDPGNLAPYPPQVG